jgi:Polyketide cyclase / dehydrase and lipid transport
MASIHKDISLDAGSGEVWAAVRDFGALHTRLVPGFVRDTRLEGHGVRIVTFANGNVVRELLIDCDEARKRLVYAANSERIALGLDRRPPAR